MIDELKFMELIASMDARIRALEQFKEQMENDETMTGVVLSGAPSYVRDYVMDKEDDK